MALAPLNNGNELKICLPGFESINRYWDKTSEMVAAKILPGEYYVTTQNEMIVTVLGSCVSACIRDPIFGIGGMNHFMLPSQNNESGWEKFGIGVATRYGNFAMEHLINEILRNGGSRKNLEVKIIGGGKILAQMTDIGDKNIRFVQEYIRTEGLKLLSQDVGDIFPRKVQYIPKLGKVRVKKLRSLHNDTIVARERAYMHSIATEQTGEIDLF
ncbi:chemoreceptor glutamine deamidase CheD [Kaarinaea lacus]